MKRIYFSSKVFAFGFLLIVVNLALAQNNNPLHNHTEKELRTIVGQRNVQWIMLNVQPNMPIDETYFEHWNYSQPDTTSGYLFDAEQPFMAPASLYLLGTKIGYYYNEFDYIDEPYYIYNVVLPIRTPEDLTASLECDDVVLNWGWEFLGHLPNVNDQFDGFNVYRNDSLLNQEPVQDTFYVDRHVSVGLYDYYVETLFTDGTHSPAYDTVTVDKDYYYGDVNVTAEGMGVSWTLENVVNVSSSLYGFDLYRNGVFLETVNGYYWFLYFPPEAPAEYCVMANFDDGCHSQIDCDTLFPAVSNSGISEENLPRFSPNPAQDFIFLDNSDEYDYILITTIRGNKLEKILISNGKPPDRIDLRNFHQGVYLLTWFKEGIQQHTQKLIIQK